MRPASERSILRSPCSVIRCHPLVEGAAGGSSFEPLTPSAHGRLTSKCPSADKGAGVFTCLLQVGLIHCTLRYSWCISDGQQAPLSGYYMGRRGLDCCCHTFVISVRYEQNIDTRWPHHFSSYKPDLNSQEPSILSYH